MSNITNPIQQEAQNKPKQAYLAAPGLEWRTELS